MVDVMASISAFSTALDLVKNLNGVENAVQVKAAIAPLYDQIISAQTSQMQLIAKVDQLEKRLAEIEGWERDAARYQLEELPPGILVYRIKPDALEGEPEHRICPTCFGNKKKSLLHNLGIRNGLTHWICHQCKFDQHTGVYVAPPRLNRRAGWMG